MAIYALQAVTAVPFAAKPEPASWPLPGKLMAYQAPAARAAPALRADVFCPIERHGRSRRELAVAAESTIRDRIRGSTTRDR